MELAGPELLLSRIPGVWARVLSYMFWPGDEHKRKAFCVYPYVALLSSLERKRSADLDAAVTYHIAHKKFLQIIGWSAFATGLPSPLKHDLRALRTAAVVLEVIRRTPKEGSLNKAFHVIGATATKYRLIGNRTDIRKVWECHRGVAHLGVGFLWLLGSATPIPRLLSGYPRDAAQLKYFLAIARDYQMFATSYTMPRQRRPLVNADEIWAIPANLPLPRRLRPLPPLPRDMLAALETYKAPQ
jgi:hypothetical protein